MEKRQNGQRFIRKLKEQWHCIWCERWHNAELWGSNGFQRKCPKCDGLFSAPAERHAPVWERIEDNE